MTSLAKTLMMFSWIGLFVLLVEIQFVVSFATQSEYCSTVVEPLETKIKQEALTFKYQPPPKEIPPVFLNEFTLNGTIPVTKYYVDDSNKGQGNMIKLRKAIYIHVFYTVCITM